MLGNTNNNLIPPACLQVTERYSRAREGVALRAGTALDQMLGDADGAASEMAQRKSPARGNGPQMAQAQRRGQKKETPIM
jgi:hypothetical protein